MIKVIKNTLLKHKLLIASFIMLVFFATVFIINSFSENVTSTIWDGTVATSISTGDGTINNPYIIESGDEFVFMLNSISDSDYFNKYYKLNTNINFNGFDLSGYYINNSFSGTIDGSGYSIYNFTINNYGTIDDTKYYSLISSTDYATIKNLNIYDVTINVEEDSYASLIGASSNTTINNLSVYNLNIINSSENSVTAGLISKDNSDNIISNVSIDVTSNATTYSIINEYDNSTISNTVVKNNGNGIVNGEYDSTSVYSYTMTEDIEFETSNTNDVLTTLNDNSEYTWSVQNGIFRITKEEATVITPNVDYANQNEVVLKSSDEAEYELQALSYTYNTGEYPTSTEKTNVRKTNYIKVTVNYFGTSVDGYEGTISISENTNKLVYNQYYEINTNGTNYLADDYVYFELIDNPFTNRPTNMAFNGWVTDTVGAKVSLDIDSYTRYIRIPVSYVEHRFGQYNEQTEYLSEDLTINLYASWIKAKVITTNGTTELRWNNVINNLESQQMRMYDNSNESIRLTSPAGLFRNVHYTNGATIPAGVYNYNGTIIESSTSCNNYFWGCDYYELVDYYDSEGNVNTFGYTTYYYLPTRDTTILFVKGYLRNFSDSATSPYTITAAYNGVDYSSTAYLQIRSNSFAYADMAIENIKIKTTQNIVTTNSYPYNVSTMLFGNWNNIKIGRGVTSDDGKVVFNAIIPGVNGSVGSSTNLQKFSLIVESGVYNSIGMTGYDNSNYYLNGKVILGSDYDKIINNNDGLIVSSGVFTSYLGTLSSNNINTPALDIYIKSGKFGNNKYSKYSGIMLNALSATYNAVQKINISGGYIYNLSGGYASDQFENKNSTIINISGGEIENIYGGEIEKSYSKKTVTQSYGNRIISITGGKVNGNIYGGSSTTELSDSAYIYIGGNANVNNVYGGSLESNVKNSTVIVSTSSSGKVNNVIGGSNNIGTVTGDSIVKLLSGNIVGNVYGGGTGRNATASDATYVAGNVDIVVGNSTTGPVVGGYIYGGSDYGTVNATSSTSEINDNHVKIEINNGRIIGSVFGGGEGDNTSVPHVKGNIDIEVNGGVISTIYGGFNNSGTTEGTCVINLNGGTIGNVYGGGNSGNTTTTEVNLKGATVNYLYGGSKNGNVLSTNVSIISGTVYEVYGGNHTGGTSDETNITIVGGDIGTVFGGGYVAGATTTNVNIEDDTLTNVYGGSKLDGIVETANVNINGGTTTNVYGGGYRVKTEKTNVSFSNGHAENIYGCGNEGPCDETKVIVNKGYATNIYGGGNKANVTGKTYVELTGGNITNIFGAGNESGAEDTEVKLISGTVLNVYGGSNLNGNITNSKVITTKPEIKDTTIEYSIDFDIQENAQWRKDQYGQEYLTYVRVTVYVKNNSPDKTLDTYSGYFYIDDSTLMSNYADVLITEEDNIYSFSEMSRWSGPKPLAPGQSRSFVLEVLSRIDKDDLEPTGTLNGSIGNEEVNAGEDLFISNLYGGGKSGGHVTNALVNVTAGFATTVYGGGNEGSVYDSIVNITDGTVTDAFAGSNKSNVENDAVININGGKVNTNVYGGCNDGTVKGNTYVNFNTGTVKGSVFGAGKGPTSIVEKNTYVKINNKAVIGTETCTQFSKCGVYGGGNEGLVGNSTNSTSTTNVIINGGTIYGNVYGGSKKNKIVGTANINIGKNDFTGSKYTNITINGNVFGGGESNEDGDKDYDYSYNGVTRGTNILIDGNTGKTLFIGQSVFASGNSSTISGTGNVRITNLGTMENPFELYSLQRATNVYIDSAAIRLLGKEDSENDYAGTLFSLSRIDNLYLKNNGILLIDYNGNIVKNLHSVDADGNLATFTTTKNGFTTNVDNRLYVRAGKNLNIALDTNVTTYGDVYGMTFLGVYRSSAVKIDYSIYDDLTVGKTISEDDIFDNGTYVQAFHQTDYQHNGFYSVTYDQNTMKTNVGIVTPIPQDALYHMWVIGEFKMEYSIDLVASKFATLGTVELSLAQYYKENTTFTITGFEDKLIDQTVLTNQEEVPRVSTNTWQSDRYMSLVIKTSNTGWISNGQTTILASGWSHDIVGTTHFVADNSTTAPSLLFYLYHSKNLMSSGDNGSIILSILVVTKINELESETETINVVVNISRELITSDKYEGAMTSGREYEIFTSTKTNVTNKSTISAYYSLYIEGKEVYKTGYKHALTSNYALPKNTKITMIDLSNDNKKYYYYIVTEQDEQIATAEIEAEGDYSYDLSKFLVMGTFDGTQHYNDATANSTYYDAANELTEEEFIFIVDFSDTNTQGNHLNNTLYLELQDAESEVKIGILGQLANNMIYNLYEDSTALIGMDITPSATEIYKEGNIDFDAIFEYAQNRVGSNLIYDTNAFDARMGLAIQLINSDGEEVSATSLLGLYFEIDGVKYYPNIDGETRIKLTDRVGNYRTKIKMCMDTATVPTGHYTVRFKVFASSDGIYYGISPASVEDIDIYIINEVYGLNITTESNSMIINSKTGLNESKESDILYNIEYNSKFDNPNIRVKLYRRDYTSEYSTTYHEVDLAQYLTTELQGTSNSLEYMVLSDPEEINEFIINFKQGLVTGTYKLEFMMYDANNKVGSIERYFIIK